uniref:Endo/exonuclease/phosphatase domain-containing protein n=1 Tax=Schistocephalus solidus TaxID=70667 RepID=A0A183TFT0_SCHSO
LGFTSSAAGCGPQIAKYAVIKLKKQQYPLSPFPAPYSPGYLDNQRSNRPGRKTVLVAGKLASYKVDIAALSETRFSWQGQLEERGQIRRYKDTLKKSLKQLQINPATWEDLAQDRPVWRESVKTGAAIYEADRVADIKSKRAACKSQSPRINTANTQALPMCPRCQRTIHARIGLVGYLQTQCNKNPKTSTSATPASEPMTTTTTTENNVTDAPPPTINDTILPPPLPALITVTNTPCPTPTTSVATSNYLSPATSTTTTAPVPAMGTWY